MSLTVMGTGSGGGILYGTTTTRTPSTILSPPRQFIVPTSTSRTSSIVSAKKASSRTGRFDSKNKRSGTTTKDDELEELTAEIENGSGVNGGSYSRTTESGGIIVNSEGVPMPVLPGNEPNFWEGPQWDGFGFFVQYMWAFGVGFALIACGIAVTTYNEGATDFKETPAYKEAIQSSNLLEEPEASTSDIFESNPTEEAPSLE